MEHGIGMKPMTRKLALSRVDLGYPDLFCIPEVTSVFFSLWLCSSALSGVPSSKSRLLTCLIGNMGLLCMQCMEIEPHFPVSGMSHGISRVPAGTRGIFSSYRGNGHSKLHFVP